MARGIIVLFLRRNIPQSVLISGAYDDNLVMFYNFRMELSENVDVVSIIKFSYGHERFSIEFIEKEGVFCLF